MKYEVVSWWWWWSMNSKLLLVLIFPTQKKLRQNYEVNSVTFLEMRDKCHLTLFIWWVLKKLLNQPISS